MFDHADIKLATKLLKYRQTQVYLHVLLCRCNYSANDRATHTKTPEIPNKGKYWWKLGQLNSARMCQSDFTRSAAQFGYTAALQSLVSHVALHSLAIQAALYSSALHATLYSLAIHAALYSLALHAALHSLAIHSTVRLAIHAALYSLALHATLYVWLYTQHCMTGFTCSTV
jgi:hypothetical protein